MSQLNRCVGAIEIFFYQFETTQFYLLCVYNCVCDNTNEKKPKRERKMKKIK